MSGTFEAEVIVFIQMIFLFIFNNCTFSLRRNDYEQSKIPIFYINIMFYAAYFLSKISENFCNIM